MDGESATGTCSGFFARYEPDAIGVLLGTGFHRFLMDSGVYGLAKVTATQLEILAVSSSMVGRGDFRNFIAAAKARFQTVIVLEVWNPVVMAALQRYGFRRVTRSDGTGEVNAGWQWDS